MPDKQHLDRDPIAGTKVTKGEGERNREPALTGDGTGETDQQTQARDTEQAFDRALGRLPPA